VFYDGEGKEEERKEEKRSPAKEKWSANCTLEKY
jgi:hypothetical protein